MTLSQVMVALRWVALAAILVGCALIVHRYNEGRDAVDKLEASTARVGELEKQLDENIEKYAKDLKDMASTHAEQMAALSRDAMNRFSDFNSSGKALERRVEKAHDLAQSGGCFFGPLPADVLDLMQDRDGQGTGEASTNR